METTPKSITLEDLKITPAKEPMSRLFSGRFNYKGYGRQIAACHLDAYFDQDLRKVFIVTEIADNPGCSITNGAEMVADAIEEKFGLGHVFGPSSNRACTLVEHYDAHSYPSRSNQDDYSIVEVKEEHKTGKEYYRYYAGVGWYGVDKSEVERLTGGPIA